MVDDDWMVTNICLFGSMVIINLLEVSINMVYGIIIIVILMTTILGVYLEISDFDDNNEKY